MQDTDEDMRTRIIEMIDYIGSLKDVEAERDAIRDELHKIASFIEPYWQDAGVKLEADWIIRVIGEMNSEADAIQAKTIEAFVKLIDARNDDDMLGFMRDELVAAIRALAQTDAHGRGPAPR
jgi:hypothetical protein